MHYLQCIAMLDYLLKQLCEGQRVQVSVSKITDIQKVCKQITTILKDETDSMLEVHLKDLQYAVSTIVQIQGLLYLPDDMRKTLVAGLNEVKQTIQILAFNYYTTNDFEPDDNNIPIFRGIVETAAEKGLLYMKG